MTCTLITASIMSWHYIHIKIFALYSDKGDWEIKVFQLKFENKKEGEKVTKLNIKLNLNITACDCSYDIYSTVSFIS